MALFRKMLYASGLLAFGVGLMLVTPTIARALSIEENSTTTTTTKSNDSDTVTSSTTASSRSRVNTEVVETTVQNIRQKAEKLVADERKTRAKLDDNAREQLCNNRKNAIENKVSAFGKAANAHLDRLDGVYNKLDAYLITHPTTDVTLTAAKAAQTTAADKVAALQTVVGDATVDCSNLTDNAAWLTQVRTAASDARTALKAYRTELKKVVVALQQAKLPANQATKQTSTTDGR